ncbi:hypothetical protein DFH27DRAFT_523046 [Peziza echinospora]|nr:hypothetical protein DFH27DRAFT_523046 [Peziza echinospora]
MPSTSKSGPKKKWASFLVPPATEAVVEGAPVAAVEPTPAKPTKTATIVEPPPPKNRKSKSSDKKAKKESYRDGLGRDSQSSANLKIPSTRFTKDLLSMTPSNHFSSDQPRWKDPGVLTLLGVLTRENQEVDAVLKKPLLPLEVLSKDVYSFLTAAHTGIRIPFLWKQCLNSLEHFVETDPTTVVSSNIDLQARKYTVDREQEPVRKAHRKSRAMLSELPIPLSSQKSMASLAGTNRPFVINFLRAICNEYSDCLAFEELRYAWLINSYGHRRIRVGLNPDDRVKVHIREDVCWRATKDPIPGVSPRDWPSKKRGVGPLFAVLTKDWEEFSDTNRSCLADLKTLLSILQDRRREASYTATNDVFSHRRYFSYIISVTSNKSPCVSINTLTATGAYLAALERGEHSPENGNLVYRRGKVISLVDLNGRIEFTRLVMGLLSRSCTMKERREEEEFGTEEYEDVERQTSSGKGSSSAGGGSGLTGGNTSSTWTKVKRKGWFSKQVLVVPPPPMQANTSPKIADWMSTLETVT